MALGRIEDGSGESNGSPFGDSGFGCDAGLGRNRVNMPGVLCVAVESVVAVPAVAEVLSTAVDWRGERGGWTYVRDLYRHNVGCWLFIRMDPPLARLCFATLPMVEMESIPSVMSVCWQWLSDRLGRHSLARLLADKQQGVCVCVMCFLVFPR